MIIPLFLNAEYLIKIIPSFKSMISSETKKCLCVSFVGGHR